MGKILNLPVFSNERIQRKERYCGKCQTTKEITEFHKNARWCKECRKIYRHKYYLDNTKYEKDNAKRYAQEHPDAWKYKEENRDMVQRRLQQRHWYHKKFGYKPKFKECSLCA